MKTDAEREDFNAEVRAGKQVYGGELKFKDGKFGGVTLWNTKTHPESVSLEPWQMAESGLLSITDRMILDQLAGRMDKLARMLTGPAV